MCAVYALYMRRSTAEYAPKYRPICAGDPACLPAGLRAGGEWIWTWGGSACNPVWIGCGHHAV